MLSSTYANGFRVNYSFVANLLNWVLVRYLFPMDFVSGDSTGWTSLSQIPAIHGAYLMINFHLISWLAMQLYAFSFMTSHCHALSITIFISLNCVTLSNMISFGVPLLDINKKLFECHIVNNFQVNCSNSSTCEKANTNGSPWFSFDIKWTQVIKSSECKWCSCLHFFWWPCWHLRHPERTTMAFSRYSTSM